MTGVTVHGILYSKRQLEDIPWKEDAPVEVAIYRYPTLQLIPDPSAGPPVTWAGGVNEDSNARAAQEVGQRRGGKTFSL